MKRSEAIELLEDFITDYEYDECYPSGESLLEFIEDRLRMLPTKCKNPRISIGLLEHADRCAQAELYGSDYALKSEDYYVNEWEPEDA